MDVTRRRFFRLLAAAPVLPVAILMANSALRPVELAAPRKVTTGGLYPYQQDAINRLVRARTRPVEVRVINLTTAGHQLDLHIERTLRSKAAWLA